MSDDAPSITCPKCGRTSYHPEDIRQRFCGVCGFHESLFDAIDRLGKMSSQSDPKPIERPKMLERPVRKLDPDLWPEGTFDDD